MQAEEYDHEALVVKGKEGDADAIEEWLSSLERDPNSQALLLSPGDRNKIAKVLCSACASSRPGCVRVARLILESLTVVSVDRRSRSSHTEWSRFRLRRRRGPWHAPPVATFVGPTELS